MPVEPELLKTLQEFFARPVCEAGTKPLKNGIEIALYLNDQGPVTLTKVNDKPVIEERAPQKPDLSFWVPTNAAKQLSELKTDDVGVVGVEILSLMAHSDPSYKMKAKVHIGLFDLLRHGYLGVIPLGGPTVMKFLASKGFTGMGKIKDAISSLKG